jgi:ADP-ribosylglycohydrolase
MDKEKYIKNYDLKLLNFKPKQTTNLHDQMKNYIRGCLYGNVIGNVMGLLTKKMNASSILHFYNIRMVFVKPFDYHKISTKSIHQLVSKLGDWTHDTDQMICVLDTIREYIWGDTINLENTFAGKLNEWLTYEFEEYMDSKTYICNTIERTTILWALNVFPTNKFKVKSEPVSTAIKIFVANRKDDYECNLHSNSGIMRTCIVGTWILNNLSQVVSIETIFSNAIKFCKTTHSSPKCVGTCMFISGLIYLLITREKYLLNLEEKNIMIEKLLNYIIEPLNNYIESFYSSIVKIFGSNPCEILTVDEIIGELKKYTNMKTLDEMDLILSSTRSYTLKPLGCAIYALKKIDTFNPTPESNDFENILIEIIKIGGDADTNCAVVGGVLGAYCGYDYIKEKHDHLLNFRYKTFLTNKINGYIDDLFIG